METIKKFREVFAEGENDTLILLIPIKIKSDNFPAGTMFTESQGLAGANFHKLKYFDLGGTEEGGVFTITSFYSQD